MPELLNGRERTVLCSIGGELVQGEAQDPDNLRWQQHERPVQHELSALGEGSNVARAIDASSAPA